MIADSTATNTLRPDDYEALVNQLARLATALDTALTAIRTLAPTGAPSITGAGDSERNVLVCRGDMWTLTFAGRTCHLRDTSGLRFLAQLLAQPGRELHVSTLFKPAPVSGSRKNYDGVVMANLGDAGISLDAVATEQYQQRLRDLRSELSDAEADNDIGRTARVREEVSYLTAELAAAGRKQRVASHAERARVTVTKGIRAVMDRIDNVHPVLGTHLRATIRTGYFCSYTPDPRLHIHWD